MVKRVALILALALSLLVALQAAHSYEQITVTDTAIGFTAATIAPTAAPQMVFAACRAGTAQMRFRYDTTGVTSATGTILEPGDWLYVSGYNNLRLFRAVRTGATSGILMCSYWDGHD